MASNNAELMRESRGTGVQVGIRVLVRNGGNSGATAGQVGVAMFELTGELDKKQQTWKKN